MKQFSARGLNRKRQQLRQACRFYWFDALVIVGVAAVAASALIRWPDKILAGIAFPVAFLIAFFVWRGDHPSKL